MKIKEERNYDTVDFLKILCAILVLMIHIPLFGYSPSRKVLEGVNFVVQNCFARIAVPFFFVASGFFLYRKTSLDDFNIGYSIQYIKRIIRLYCIWSIIYIPVNIRDILNDEKGVAHATVIYLRNIVFSGSYMHLWFLPALVVAVMLTSCLLYKGIRPKTIIVIAGLLYFIGLFGVSWFGFIKPIEIYAPQLWKGLRIIKSIIATTRNGLFEGFLFVAIGMSFSYKDFKYDKGIAVIGIILSVIALITEVFTLQAFGFIRQYDFFLSLVPLVWFMFYFAINTSMPFKLDYKRMRTVSSLIFYIQLWIDAVVNGILWIVYKPLYGTGIRFLITLISTILISVAMIRISEYKRFAWLKKLYN